MSRSDRGPLNALETWLDSAAVHLAVNDRSDARGKADSSSRMAKMPCGFFRNMSSVVWLSTKSTLEKSTPSFLYSSCSMTKM